MVEKQITEVSKKNKPQKDWRLIEYFVPITEAINSGNDFLIRGVAINETTTRNGVTYNATELESAAPSFRNKPVMIDHSGSIKDIVGRTTDNVNFNPLSKAIEFEGRIMDDKIKEMINDGRITDVSIGAKIDDLIKNEDDDSFTAVGMEGLEISLVAVPGDPGARLANALNESYNLKEKQMANENSELTSDENEDDTELNNNKEENMEEAETSKVEQPVEEPKEEVKKEEVKKEEVKKDETAEEKVVKVDMTETNKSIATLTEQVAALTKKVAEQDETPAPSAEKAEEDEIPAKPVEDETTGEVGAEEEESEGAEESFVVEKADVGNGFQIYRDYSKATGKFNRLCR